MNGCRMKRATIVVPKMVWVLPSYLYSLAELACVQFNGSGGAETWENGRAREEKGGGKKAKGREGTYIVRQRCQLDSNAKPTQQRAHAEDLQ